MAAEKGGREVALPVLSATLTTVVVFFPVTFLYGVSRYLFSALALAVVLSLFASYVVAMTVVPLFCARFIKTAHRTLARRQELRGAASTRWFNARFESLPRVYDRAVGVVLAARRRRSRRASLALRRQPRAFSLCSASPSSRAPTPASS